MNYVYGDYSALATGGAIGDVLFYFCSGFTLFLGRVGRFDEWYKRRIRRIYPSVFGWAIVAFMIGMVTYNIQALVKGVGEFVTMIMIFYLVLYIIRKFAIDRINWAFAMACAIVLLWYVFFFDEKQDVLMYKRLVRWPCYFLYMLMGAMMGRKNKEGKLRHVCVWKSALLFVVSVFLFYGIQIIGKKIQWVSEIQIITLIPLFGIVYSLYQIAASRLMTKVFTNKIVQWVILVVGGLCLEIYFVQMPILIDNTLPFGLHTDMLQNLFPLNVPILLAVVLVLAYVTRAVGRWFMQTFDSVDGYEWKKIMAIK